jgi:hypothetical protein
MKWKTAIWTFYPTSRMKKSFMNSFARTGIPGTATVSLTPRSQEFFVRKTKEDCWWTILGDSQV